MTRSHRRWRRRPLVPLLALILGLWAAAAMVVTTEASGAGTFRYRSYGEMAARLLELNATYPEVVRVFVAQDRYRLPYPRELQCVEDDATGVEVPCRQFVVHVTNHSTLAASPARPEVFFSGALHGDERVGPITTIEMVALLAESAMAHARGGSDATKDTATARTRRWLHHLVNTRSVFLIPMTNAYGYAHEQRTELGVDPNRDYNYMRAGPECMQTMTSRVVNELWRDHVFQLSITFHGGMRAVAYEWGSPNHYLEGNPQRSEKSPDHQAQFDLANVLSAYAGPFANDGTLYPTGTMNDIVYGVTGGMEDWGYGASWENQYATAGGDDDSTGDARPFQPCKPTTFGGYPADKTIYNNVTHRAFNILVETSNEKHPPESALGSPGDLYGPDLDFIRNMTTTRVGHVTRNVRLALMLVEMVQPYLRWIQVPTPPMAVNVTAKKETARDEFLSASVFADKERTISSWGCADDPSPNTHVTTCDSTTCTIRREAGKKLQVQIGWEVLGALQVDRTKLQLASSSTFKDVIAESPVHTGFTRRYYDFSDPLAVTSKPPSASLFAACITIPSTDRTSSLFLRAVAVVDQNWRTQGTGDDAPSPRIPPQSHLVNARTNRHWHKASHGHQVRGSLHWFSPTIVLNLTTTETTTPTPTATTSIPAVVPSMAPAVASTSESPVPATGSNSTSSSSEPSSSSGDNSSPPTTRPLLPTAPPTTANPSNMTSPPPGTQPSEAGSSHVASAGSDSEAPPTLPPAPSISQVVAPATPTPTITSPPPASDHGVDGDDLEDEDDDDIKADDTSLSPTPSPMAQAPPTTTPPSPPKPTGTSTASAVPLSGRQKAESASGRGGSSLLSYGYLTLATGGIIVVLTVAYLYRRVFRAAPRRTYMHLHQHRGSTQVRTVHGDDDDDDVEEDEDDL